MIRHERTIVTPLGKRLINLYPPNYALQKTLQKGFKVKGDVLKVVCFFAIPIPSYSESWLRYFMTLCAAFRFCALPALTSSITFLIRSVSPLTLLIVLSIC